MSLHRKILKRTGQVSLALITGFVLVVLVFAWKLSQGPVSLPQLTPYILEAVSRNTRGIRLTIDDTIISWEGWGRNLDVRVLNADIFTRDGRRLATIPQAAVTLSVPALLDGVFAPSSIELIRPEIHLVRREDGAFSFAFGDGMSLRADRTFQPDEFISTTPSPERPLSYLKEIAVLKAEFDYEDMASSFRLNAPDTTLRLERLGETLVLETSLNVAMGARNAKLDLMAGYNLTTEIVDVETKIAGLYPSDLAQLEERLAPLSALDFPVSGKINLVADKNAQIRSFYSDLSAAPGKMVLPAPLTQTLEIDTMALRAGYENFNEKIRVEEALLALKSGSTVSLSPFFKHAMPVDQLRLSGTYDLVQDQIKVDELNLELGKGPIGVVRATIDGVLKKKTHKIDLLGEIQKVSPSNLHLYWPEDLSSDARVWVVNNISNGIVHRAGIDLSVTLDNEGGAIIHHAHGDMQMDGVTVDYLSPMPVVTNGSGYANFDDKSFRITVTGGEVGDIKVKSGQIDILDLDKFDQRFELDLTAFGSLRDTLKFIDNKPLEFSSALGIDPAKTSGQTETNLKLSFLLLKNLRWDDVEVTATAVGEDVVIRDVILDQDLTKGKISLQVDKKGMEVEGGIVLGTIPAQLQWRENFSRNTLFKRRFLLDGMVNDKQRMGELKLNFPPFTTDIMQGPLHVDATITEDWDGHGAVETFIDLAGANINIPVLEWSKDAKKPGQAYAKVTYQKGRLIGVPYFSINADDLRSSGSIGLDAEGTALQIIRLSRFQAGRTDVTGGTFLFHKDIGWEVDVHGNSFDLSQAIAQARLRENKGEVTNEDTNIKGTFSGRFNKVWLDEKHSLNTVAAAVTSDGKLWTATHATGVVGGGKPFMIDVSPKEGNRTLRMETKDAGALLRALDLFDDMKGGDLVIDGIFNDDVPHRPLVGNILVNDYRITKVPALAKLLSLAALTGVLDSLQGDGIGFSKLISPFKYDRGTFEFKEGRTNGLSLGLTWEGQIKTNENKANLNGTIVPAYGLNSLLGNVPIIGTLLGGSEKGGGLFAWTFTVKNNLKDPDVSINAVSALAPGILRNLFKDTLDTAKPETPPEKTQEQN